jgi:PAS domain S-box-containing protein
MEPSNWPERSLPAETMVLLKRRLITDADDGYVLAQAIVDAIREPLLVLDAELRVVTVNRSFRLMFGVNCSDVQGRPVCALGDGEWNIPELRLLLKNVVQHHAVMESYEVEQNFPGVGRLTMLLHARKVVFGGNSDTTILLAIEDITQRRVKERAQQELLQQKEFLLQEMQHRVANSLQIIAGILLIKARAIRSEKTRQHLLDAYRRVISVAAVQRQLQVPEPGAAIALGPYLSGLCETLADSMIDDRRQILLKVEVRGDATSPSEALRIGLIVTELVINALKHAFPRDRSHGVVIVAYDRAEPNWRLAVSDNGIGSPEDHADKTIPGLGTTIIQALAKQLDAHVETLMNPVGTTVSITNAPFASLVPVWDGHSSAAAGFAMLEQTGRRELR